jgi:parvulin-like peptidyl-prolyl isomerase
MNAWDQLPAIVVDGAPISLGKVLRQAQIGGQLQFLESSIREHLVSRAIAARQLSVRAEEIARARAVFASDMRLASDAAVAAWLSARGMDERSFEEEIRRIIAFGKLKEEVAGALVEPYFEEHKADFDSAVISRILVTDLAAGVRVKAELDTGAAFDEVALRESLDPKTRLMGGWVGRVRRRDLTPFEAEFVFAGPVPTISDPISLRNGAVIVRVERVFRAQLDQPTRAEIHERLFAEWLERERRESNVELKLFEVLT